MAAGRIEPLQPADGAEASTYEGAAVAIANSAPALSKDRRFGVSAKYGTFRGQNALGAMAQVRVSDNVVLNGSLGGGFHYGGIGGGVGGMMEW